jgi:hypothetical protein
MKVTLAYQDQEQAIYVDGVLVLKGFDLELREIFQALHVDFNEQEVDMEWFAEQNYKFPRTSDWIKFV